MMLPLCLLILAGEPWPLRNADFAQQDAQGQPVDWRHGSHDGGDYTFSALTEDGVSFARIEGAAPEGRAYWSQVIGPFACPKAVRVRFRYRGTAAQMDGFLRLRDAQDAAVELARFDWRHSPLSDEWQTFEQTWSAPAAARDAAQGVRAEVIIYERGIGRVDYTDFVLEPLEQYTPDWPTTEQPLQMPYRPADKQVCQQNPPDFSWPPVLGADGYELEVSRTAGFDAVAQAASPAENFWNFSATFEPGVWYWRVRAAFGEDRTAWAPVRRFRIDPDAWAFPVPPVDELLARCTSTHPRIWANQETLAAFRARAEGLRKNWFATVEKQARDQLAIPLAEEPTFAFERGHPLTAEWIAAHNKLRGAGEGAASRALRTAFVYLVTGDREIGESAVAQLLNLASWDPEGATGYRTHDQVHRAIAYRSAMAYDWVSDLLTPEQRQTILAMIEQRTNTMYQHLAVGRPLREQPYESHGWTAYGYIGIIALATLHDLPAAEVWFRDVVPTYLNLCPPWGGEDGGWIQGVGYWQYSQGSNKEFYDALLSAVGINLYDKAWSRNNLYFPLYYFPAGSPRSHFGDENRAVPGLYSIFHYKRLAQMYQDPVAQWAWQQIGDRSDGNLESYYRGDETLPARPPVELPPSRWSKDIGWVAMHSDLLDPQRVSMYFKSSWIGSFNHSHADQNQFVINAFGEALAIDSGYYDWYGSPHDRGYTRHTLAHNAITYDGGHGQPIFDATASGKVLGLVSTPSIDICGGDATAAYHGQLGKAVRRIVYLRPASFVVIDDLAAPVGQTRRFEWWLHALSPIAIDDDQAGATISQGAARLRVKLRTPTGLTAAQRDEYIGPPESYPKDEPAVPLRPQGRGDAWPDQAHAWFTTPDLPQTRLVSTLEAYRDGTTPTPMTSTREGETLVLTQGEARVLVALGEGVRQGELASDAPVVAVDGATGALADGTWLTRDGQRFIESDRPVSVGWAPDRFAVTSLDDAVVRITTGQPAGLWDERGRPVPAEQASWAAGVLTIRAEPGQWTFRLTPPAAAEQKTALAVSASAGGPVELQSAAGFDGQPVAWGNLANTAGLYRVGQLPEGLSLAGNGPVRWLGAEQPVLLRGAAGPLELERLVDTQTIEVSSVPAEDTQRDGAATWWEAETFTKSGGGNPSRYTTRAFLSGGVGVGEWTVPGMWLEWPVKVPAAGTYDLLLKAASHTGAQRVVQLGNQLVTATLPASPGFGATPAEWLTYRLTLRQALPAGETTLRIWCAEGHLNLDWLALVP